ncbi:Uu.00g003310.m01.CDS01 [Anthostomella pinea]|uniref:Uu.00g003310.m01.CDS01 n=1 Tax=Anthostomella pinea TaxID=933095 RepID=A0AAI8VJQ4_9PEZI|nr:Uu.00g003310.m01.CDS01 [Anthostomella pinea]
MRNLIDLAAAAWRHAGVRPVTFQLISAIGVVGRYAVDSDNMEIPEHRVPMAAALPLGYCEAKWICERLLDQTLHRQPARFRAMVVRPGQIARSRENGYWNPTEHFAFLVKSCQSLQVLPALQGRLQWVPVEDVAATVVELGLREGTVYPVYHVDNPVGQPWDAMLQTLALELGISEIVPLRDCVRRVRHSPLSMETENPALRLIDFLADNFERMSCGGLVPGTTQTRQHSVTLAALGPVPEELARKYVRAWKRSGFLAC